MRLNTRTLENKKGLRELLSCWSQLKQNYDFQYKVEFYLEKKDLIQKIARLRLSCDSYCTTVTTTVSTTVTTTVTTAVTTTVTTTVTTGVTTNVTTHFNANYKWRFFFLKKWPMEKVVDVCFGF